MPFLFFKLRYGACAALFNIFVILSAPFSAAADAPVTVLALGDSLTAGYGLAQGEGLVPQLNAWFKARGDAVQVINGGVSGDTAAGGAARLEWLLTPDVGALMVILGGNDLLRGLPSQSTRDSIEKILRIAQQRDLPVLLVGMKAPRNFGPAYKQAFDALYPELAAQYNASFIDSFFGLIDPDAADLGQLGAFMQADGIHPNPAGVAKVVERLGPALQTLTHRR